jgi:hypothetical protein
LRQRCRELMEDAEFDCSLEHLDQLGLLFQERGKVIGLALPKESDTHQTSQMEAKRSRLPDDFTTGVRDRGHSESQGPDAIPETAAK